MKRNLLLLCLACMLLCSACEANSTAAVDNTTLLETTSETVMTEETTTATEDTKSSTEESITTTTAATTVSEETSVTDDEEYTVETEEETTAATKPKAVSDADRLNYSISKATVRSYSDHDGNNIFSEPSAEDKELLEKAKDSLTVYERYNNFIDHKNYNEAAYEGKGKSGAPFIMDDYLDENENAVPKLKFVFTSDFNGDGHEESLLVINTATKFTEMGAQNEFLVYINDNGEAVPVMQECAIEIYDVLDYGDFKYTPISVGDNNASAGTYIFDFNGTDCTEKLYVEFASPAYDKTAGRIYFTVQGHFSSCYILDSKTLEYNEYDAPQEEFDKFIKDYNYEW